MRFLIAVLVAAVVASAAAAQTQRTPRIWLVTVKPVTVAGTQFTSGERVRVTAALGEASFAKTVTASRLGRFTARWTRSVSDSCYGIVIRATGSQGSKAVWKLVVECAPPLEPRDPPNK